MTESMPEFPSDMPSADEVDTDLVVVTGLSGGGRSTVARALENVGFYVVDNLPQALMLDMAELASRAGSTARRTAMVLDVRSRAFSTDLAGAIRALKDRGFQPRVVFVDADDEVLIRRFESVRRAHPLQVRAAPIPRRCVPAAVPTQDRVRPVPADPRPRARPDHRTASEPRSPAAGDRREGLSL